MSNLKDSLTPKYFYILYIIRKVTRSVSAVFPNAENPIRNSLFSAYQDYIQESNDEYDDEEDDDDDAIFV